MKAFAYIRCSGLGQMDRDGPVRQRLAIQDFANLNGYEVVRWYEESHTGSDLEGRPEFRDMRAELVSDGVHVVIVEKLDRLARSIMVQETILADFKKHKIELFSATVGEDGLCGDDPTRVLIRQILGVFFEYERKMISSRLKSARDRIRENGRPADSPKFENDKRLNKRAEGPKPYGSLHGEDIFLGIMRELRDKGNDDEAIAKRLNYIGVPTRKERRWHGATIHKILARDKSGAQDVRQQGS